MDVKRTLFSFNGRLRRRDWWLWSIGLALIQNQAIRMTDTVLLGPDADAEVPVAPLNSQASGVTTHG